MHILQTFWHKLIHIGMNSSMSYVEKKRMLMVNIIALSCIPFMTYFAVANLIDERYLLASINIANTSSSILTLVFQYFNRHKSAKITLLICSYICFFTSALLFQNSGQYYLLSILIISMLRYDDYRIHIISSCFIISAIIIIELLAPLMILNNPLPKTRIIFNILGSISFILVAINFYIQIIYNKMKKIEDQRLRLHIANQEKERIFSIIAHDIKSPFATLESLANGLYLKILEREDTQLCVEEIYNKIAQQNKALDDLLRWGSSNIKGGKKTASSIFVRPLIEGVISFFTEQYTNKKVTIKIDILENTQVYANVDHLTIILRNLISNAIKFSHKNGEINIYSTCEQQKTFIHIEDCGIGINEIKKTLLFTEIQNRSIGTSDEPGSGLGLVLCRDLIEQNLGTITIESTVGKGSTFTIGLPNHVSNSHHNSIENKYSTDLAVKTYAIQ